MKFNVTATSAVFSGGRDKDANANFGRIRRGGDEDAGNLVDQAMAETDSSANRGKYEIALHQSQPVTHIAADCRRF